MDQDQGANANYGSWPLYADASEIGPHELVTAYLGEWVDRYDVEGLVKAYVARINEALPEGVSLHGRELYGPYPLEPAVAERIKAAIIETELDDLLPGFEKEKGADNG